jgi:hypothetical protein
MGIRLLVPVLLLAAAAHAFQVDLVPASRRPEAEEIEGTLSIGGEDGTIRVTIENVNDAGGTPLDSAELTVHLKLRIGGERRRLALPLAVEAGDGQARGSLGLTPDVQVVVSDVRVRGPDRRTLAVAGVVTMRPAVAPPPEPPTLSDCPLALATCQQELLSCSEELEECEAAE